MFSVIAGETLQGNRRKSLHNGMRGWGGWEGVLGRDSPERAMDSTRNELKCRNGFSTYFEEYIRN